MGKRASPSMVSDVFAAADSTGDDRLDIGHVQP
jgi:hypothetical protein